MSDATEFGNAFLHSLESLAIRGDDVTQLINKCTESDEFLRVLFGALVLGASQGMESVATGSAIVITKEVETKLRNLWKLWDIAKKLGFSAKDIQLIKTRAITGQFVGVINAIRNTPPLKE